MSQTTSGKASDNTVGTLGTVGGVFTPSILTILGLVLFLRVAYVAGSVGLIRALVILGLATSVSVLTSISLAVVATNLKVRGGGEYFIISRTLGIEFGGAVGVVLYVAISVSIAFYAIGFAEAFVSAFDSDSTALVQLVAAVTVVVLMGIGLIGSNLATRLQYVVMALLVLSLVSFFAGVVSDFDSAQISDNLGDPGSDVGFWEAFAVFFPAVTGFSQGVAMSGDLKTPSRSITRGTFAAVGLSTVVYLAAFVLLAGAAPAAVLVEETTTIMGDVSLATWTMLAGVLAATLSSALASTLGGPRVLQRLGQDRVLPRLEVFADGAGPTNNPRRATVVSAAIALVTVAAGDLNSVAPIISMFFLASYGLINYATYYEIRAGSTGFRPRFRWYDQRASLAGTVLCAGSIVAINPLAGTLAALVLGGLYSYLRNRDVPERWLDSASSHHYTRARKHLRSLADERPDIRDWRPCTLVFVQRDPVPRHRMMTAASWLEGQSGFTTAVRMVEGHGAVLRRQVADIEADLRRELQELSPDAYARVVQTDDLVVGVQTLVQAHGIGSIEPNLALFGVYDLRNPPEDREEYGRMLQTCIRFGATVGVLSLREDAWQRFEATPPDQRTIALWWSDDQLGQLITLLGWLCQRHSDWDEAEIVAYVPVSDDPHETGRVEQLLHEARIKARVFEVDPTPAAFAHALGQATLALAPLRVRRGQALGPFDTPLGMLVEGLPLAVMVLATESLDLDAQPDESDLAEFATVTDQAAQAQKRIAELDAKAGLLLVEAEALRLHLVDAKGAKRAELEAAVHDTEARAASAYRAYVDARTRSNALIAQAATLADRGAGVQVDPDVWRSSRRRP